MLPDCFLFDSSFTLSLLFSLDSFAAAADLYCNQYLPTGLYFILHPVTREVFLGLGRFFLELRPPSYSPSILACRRWIVMFILVPRCVCGPCIFLLLFVFLTLPRDTATGAALTRSHSNVGVQLEALASPLTFVVVVLLLFCFLRGRTGIRLCFASPDLSFGFFFPPK